MGGGGGGGGAPQGWYIRLWCGGRGMRSDRHSFPSDGCDALWRSGPGLYTWPVRKPWWSNPRHRLTLVARCFIGLSLPHPPKPRHKLTYLLRLLNFHCRGHGCQLRIYNVLDPHILGLVHALDSSSLKMVLNSLVMSLINNIRFLSTRR